MAPLPGHTRHCFWDVRFDGLDTEKQAFLVIERILDYGSDRDFRWLLKHYGDGDIRAVITKSRSLSRRSGQFWRCYFNLEENEIRCLQPPSSRAASRHWNE
ncbi:MAG: hypothetical protein M0Z41_02820 [Peptococcaceae bacterium]|jgi:hypothetical protein|nr:hypothetical protein [Peptococcaceae bacterium]